MSKLTRAPIALVALLATCSTTGTRRPKPGSREDAQHALVDLQRGEFAAAEDAARELLERDEHNPYGNVVAALTLYKRTVHDVTIDAASVIGGAVLMGGINHRYIDFALRSAAERLDRVAEHLGRASNDASFSMELCLACWETDWNRDGRINERDSLILQVEYDEHGDRLARHDPRRRPTFHFDIGDIFWARAMVDFQRAAVAIGLGGLEAQNTIRSGLEAGIDNPRHNWPDFDKR
jgi:YD repeat-containing protein